MYFTVKVVYVPTVMPNQVPTYQWGQTKIEALQVSLTLKVVDALTVMPNQVPTYRRVQITIKAVHCCRFDAESGSFPGISPASWISRECRGHPA